MMRVAKKLVWITLLLSLFSLGSTVARADDDDDSNLLHVTGTGKSSVMAKMAEVRLHIEVTNQAVQEIHSQLSAKNKKVLDTLRKKGAQKLTTTQMSIFPQYDRKQNNKVIGYRGNMAIMFRTSTDEAGPMIDAALQAGANRMDGFTLIPDEKELAAAQTTAYEAAAKDAMDRTKVILSALGLEKDGIYEVRVGAQPRPYMQKQYRAMAAMEAAPATEITPGEQEVVATVHLKVHFKAKDY